MTAQPRLLDRVRATMRARHMSSRTEQVYVSWIRRYIRYHGVRHPSELGDGEVVAFLTYLAAERRVARSTQIQAMSALMLLYRDVLRQPLGDVRAAIRSTAQPYLPAVLSRGEIEQLLAQFGEEMRLIALLLYGGGLRLMECLTLRVKDLDLERLEIRIRRGKGGKDRVTMFPRSACAALERQLAHVRALHERDLAAGGGSVVMPDALDRKAPSWATDLAWQWVFPARRCYRDPETGEARRHHFHETAVQREMKRAVRAAGLAKRATAIHPAPLLRNPFAGRWLRHPDGAGIVGAFGRGDDDDLHARAEPWRAWGTEPSGSSSRVAQRIVFEGRYRDRLRG